MDVSLSNREDVAVKQEDLIKTLMQSTVEQFSGIFRRPPDIEGKFTTSSSRTIMRVKFRIWPGGGAPIENQFKQELLQSMKKIDENYADWMLAVNYEVEQKTEH